MSETTIAIPEMELSNIGLNLKQTIHYQLSPEELVQDTIRIGDGQLSDTGALVINTGKFTGRSPKDKFTVRDETTENVVHWNEFNIPIETKYFDIIYKKMI